VKHQPPALEVLSPETRAQLERFRVEHAGEPRGAVADRVLFEDEHLRIWELTLLPGQATALHHHPLDYYLVILSGDRVAGIPPKGEGDPYVGLIPPEGNTVRVPKGSTEWAWNVGEKTYREILIERKRG